MRRRIRIGVAEGKAATPALGLIIAAMVLAGGAVVMLALRSRGRITGGSPAERIQAVARLADEQPRGAADALAEAAAAEPHPDVRRAAMIALGRFPSPRSRAVVEAGAADGLPAIRAAAALSLGLYEDESASDALARMAASDPAEEVRVAAVDGLARLKCPQRAARLAEVMEHNDSPAVQRRAAEVLGKQLGFRLTRAPSPGSKAWSELLRTVNALVRQQLATGGADGGAGKE